MSLIKLVKTILRDPSSALLEALDPEQNDSFRDHYIDIPYDLSKILFIATANILDTIPITLRDRLEIIHLPGYLKEEKVHIGKKHLIPKQMIRHGLQKKNISFTDKGLEKIIECYARESGVRNFEKQITKIMRKSTVKILKNPKKTVRIGTQNVESFLGLPKFRESPLDKKRIPGIAVGLAWTSMGGSVLSIESIGELTDKPQL